MDQYSTLKMKLLVVLLLLSPIVLVRSQDDDDDDDFVNIPAIPIPDGISGNGKTSRYWDCCKPVCAWPNNTNNNWDRMVSCGSDGFTILESYNESGCDGGDAYACSDQHAYAINDTFAIGFVATSFGNPYCCACVLFSFIGELAPKQMLVQFINTGYYVEEDDTHLFNLAIPGSAFGDYDTGCTNQWGDDFSWGELGSIDDCQRLPEELREGCEFRFTWLRGVQNPDVTFYQVECPRKIIFISQCDFQPFT